MLIKTTVHTQYVYSYSEVANGATITSKVHPNKIGLKYVNQGGEIYETEKGKYRVGEGNLLFLNSDTEFEGSITSRNTLTKGVCIDIDTSLLPKKQLILLEKLFVNQQLPVASTFLGKQLSYAEQLNEDIIHDFVLQATDNLLAFCNEFNRVNHELHSDFKKRETALRNTYNLWQAREFIFRNAAREFSLQEISNLSGISKFKLARLFKSTFGITPLAYHHSIRLQKAVELLQYSSDIDFTQIAYEAGYESLATFSKRFKKHFGISPTAYKKSNIEQMRDT